MENYSQILLYIGAVETFISLLIFIFDIIPKQVREVHITKGTKGVDSTAVALLIIVGIKVFLLSLSLSLFICRRTLCGSGFVPGLSSIINGTVILLLAFTWKYLYRNYKNQEK